MDGTDGLEERSARERLSQSQYRVGWSPRISRTPLGFEIEGPFAFSDRTRKAKAEDPKLKELERENARLKRRLARVETMLEIPKKPPSFWGSPLNPLESDENGIVKLRSQARSGSLDDGA